MDIYLDNIIFYLQKSGGISVYWSELIRGLTANRQHIVLIEPSGHSENIFYKNAEMQGLPRHNTLWRPSIERYLPIRARISNPAIVHSSYYRIMPHSKAANIVTVHDFTYELYRNGIAKHTHHWQKRHAILHADGIICVSENTKSDLLKYFPEVPEQKIRVIHHGVSDAYRPLADKNIEHYPELGGILDKKYAVYVGDRRGYKNFRLAIESLAIHGAMHLVIVGGGNLTGEEVELLEQQLPNRFHYAHEIDNQKLNILYNFAMCLIHPSAYEGFGMPVLEALTAGCPVVALCMSSIPEICGGACACARTAEPEAFVERIKLLENAEYRKHAIAQGRRRSASFSWEKCMAETLGVYRDVYTEKFGERTVQ